MNTSGYPSSGPRRLPFSEIARRKTPEYKLEKFLSDIPFLNGKSIGPITLNTEETEVNHQLGKPARGYLVLSQNSFATICCVELSLPPPANETEEKLQEIKKNSIIILKASEEVKVTMWIF